MAIYKVSLTDDNFTLQEINEVQSILQNIALILRTRKGTVPMSRDFGLAQEFLDKPIDIAESLAFSEIMDAIEEYEPRAKLNDVTFRAAENGAIIIDVEVNIEK